MCYKAWGQLVVSLLKAIKNRFSPRSFCWSWCLCTKQHNCTLQVDTTAWESSASWMRSSFGKWVFKTYKSLQSNQLFSAHLVGRKGICGVVWEGACSGKVRRRMITPCSRGRGCRSMGVTWQRVLGLESASGLPDACCEMHTVWARLWRGAWGRSVGCSWITHLVHEWSPSPKTYGSTLGVGNWCEIVSPSVKKVLM